MGLGLGLTTAAHAAPKLSGAVPYQFGTGNTTVTLGCDAITNSSAENATGTIQVQLWALSEKYVSGRISGKIIAGYKLDGLEGGRQYSNLKRTLKTAMPAQRGSYYLCLTVSEFREGGYVITDFRNYTNAVTLGPLKLFTLLGPWSWQTNPEAGTISMKVKKISHTRTGKTGSLKLSVWATTKPGFTNKAGGTYYEMGSVVKKQLEPGYSYTDVENTAKYKRPPSGTYYLWLVLLESNGEEYVTMATLASEKPYTFK
jgi:hypothetical protein